jgi:hypothetical protein
MTSVILVQYNNAHLTQAALRSFFEHHLGGFEIVVVDNGSENGRIDELRDEFPGIRLVQNNVNIGFSAANNRAVDESRGDLLLFLNNDTLCTMDVLTPLEEEFLCHPEIGVIGPKLLNADGSYQLSCGALPTFYREMQDRIIFRLADRNVPFVRSMYEQQHRQKRAVGWVTGAALCIRRNLFLQIGGFDEKMFMYFEDKDLCQRVTMAGKSVVYFPDASITHLKGASSAGLSSALAKEKYRKSQIWYYKKQRPGWEQSLLKMYLTISGNLPRGDR